MAKFIICDECDDVVLLVNEITRTCGCGKCAGKYLKDNITAVVTKDAIVFGIDNVTFRDALIRASDHKDLTYRRDFFFTGWVPNHPGEIIRVNEVEDVKDYPYDEYQDLPDGDCTNPTTD